MPLNSFIHSKGGRNLPRGGEMVKRIKGKGNGARQKRKKRRAEKMRNVGIYARGIIGSIQIRFTYVPSK